jgi:hypothetical protein
MHWPACYEIQLAEALDTHLLVWFVELGMQPEGCRGETGTLLRGALTDPAALFGLIARIRDLNLTVIEIRRIEA